MNAPLPPDRIRELIGGYATGTLTPEERAALMQAALEDQSLFDALMDEEALRETLADRALRAELLAALEPKPRWWRTPWPWAALASATAAAALFVLLRPQPQPQTQVASLPAAREIAANLPKPEPEPSQIALPNTLRIQQAAPRMTAPQPEAREAKRLERMDAPAAAGNVAASPAFQAAEKAEASAAPPPAPAVRVTPAEAGPAARLATVADASKEDRKPGPPASDVELAWREPDGAWKIAEAGAPLPAGRALRLRLTSPVTGTLQLEPRLAPPLAVEAGVAAEWMLPAQSRGELVLRVSLAAPPARSAAPLGMQRAKVRAEAATAADSALVGGAANRPAPFSREIRLRVE
jgi:hypothetical protein